MPGPKKSQNKEEYEWLLLMSVLADLFSDKHDRFMQDYLGDHQLDCLHCLLLPFILSNKRLHVFFCQEEEC